MVYCLDAKFKGQPPVRCVPGGKYGCAQLVKHFAEPALTELSLGNISALLQLAVDEGYISYFKTVIYWTDSIKTQQLDLSKNSHQLYLESIKSSIKTLIEERGKYVPMARIPKLLNERFGLQLIPTKLGYSKLLDLIVDLGEDFSIEYRDKNYPVVVLNPPTTRIPNFSSDVSKFLPAGLDTEKVDSKQKAILDLMAQFHNYCLNELVKMQKTKGNEEYSLFSTDQGGPIQ